MSAILSAETLNDFISPGVACIKPVETLPSTKSQGADDYEVSFNTEPSKASSLPPAQISLTDCLACSGCVTSAEAVLVSLQSHDEVLQNLESGPALRLRANDAGTGLEVDSLEQGGKLFVASISPQSRASIAATFAVSEKEAGFMIEHLLSGPQGLKSRAVYRNGFQWVVDTNVAREACLVLGAEEMIASMQAGQETTGPDGSGARRRQPSKPILTSSCPGWICYAEKTHPYILPHLSRLKSPQALMGTLLKTTLSRKLGISPDRIWHLAIMPCFDKKLEASREELTDAIWGGVGPRGIRDVDCVITSKELLMLADSMRVDFSTLPRSPLPKSPFPDRQLHYFLFPPARRKNNFGPEAGTSGGYLHYILQYFVSQQEGASIQVSKGRNADITEYSVISASGEPIVQAARYYGFRNIQNLVRRLKPSQASRMPGGKAGVKRMAARQRGPDHAYIEVMACPGGCTNGGGQIKVDDPIVSGHAPSEVKPGPQEQKRWLAQIDEAYFSGEDAEDDAIVPEASIDMVAGISPPYIKDLMGHWSNMTGIDLERLVYTSYRAVVSDVGKEPGETEKVIELASKIGGGW